MVRELHSTMRWGGTVLLIHFVSLPLGHMAGLRALSLLGVLVVAALVWNRLPPCRMGSMAALFAAWLALALASLTWSINPAYTLESALTDVPRSALLFWAGHTLARGGCSWRFSAWAGSTFLLICVPLAVMAPRNSMGIWEAGWLPASGDYATATLVCLPLIVAALWTRSGSYLERLFLWAGLAAGLYGGYLCASRAFWLVLLVMVGTAGLCYLHWRGNWRSHGRRYLAIGLLILMAALMAASMAARQRDLPLLQISERARLYPEVILKLLNGPVLGIGYGKETNAEWYLDKFPDMPGVRHPHNIVLSFVDQMGILGLPLLAALFGLPAWRFYRLGWARRADGEAVAVTVAGLALLVGVFVKNSTDLFFYKQHLWMLYGLLGLMLGFLERTDESLSRI